jgi:hypothetical protein
MSPSSRHAVLAVALLVPWLWASRSEACGGNCGIRDAYDNQRELEECLAGRLGDLAQRLPRCRAVGFLLLNGQGLSEEDRGVITRALTARFDYLMGAPTPWKEARAKVAWGGTSQEVMVYRDLGMQHYPNCLAGAFSLAAKTLEERQARFGPNSPEVAAWVAAQDRVFQNCGGSETVVEPAPAPPEAPPLIQADRAYQTAAAYFYAGRFNDALQRFDAIARDEASPWRKWARLVAVRALIREALVQTEAEAARNVLLEKARERTEAILKDPAMQELHRQTRPLRWLVDYHLRPDSQLQVLGRVLLEKPDENFGIAFKDYFRLRAARKPGRDELSQFLDSFEAPDGYATARAAWKRTKSVAWLVAALNRARHGDAGLKELVAASKAVPESSLASEMLHMARGRLAVEAGQWEEARAEVLPLLESRADKLAPEIADGLSTHLLYAASSFEEWAKYAHLSKAAAHFLTHGVPLARYTDEKLLAALPDMVRVRVVYAGWTRAVLTDREEVRQALQPRVEHVLQERLGQEFARLRSATTLEERKFVALVALLKVQGLSPFVSGTGAGEDCDYTKGWCSRTPAQFYADCEASRKPCAPRFISPQERKAVRREDAQVESLGRTPDVLIRGVLDYAKKHPEDPLVPEALHLAVHWTFRGKGTFCPGDTSIPTQESRRWSKAAFQLLHRKYAQTEWAQKTPHYY